MHEVVYVPDNGKQERFFKPKKSWCIFRQPVRSASAVVLVRQFWAGLYTLSIMCDFMLVFLPEDVKIKWSAVIPVVLRSYCFKMCSCNFDEARWTSTATAIAPSVSSAVGCSQRQPPPTYPRCRLLSVPSGCDRQSSLFLVYCLLLAIAATTNTPSDSSVVVCKHWLLQPTYLLL